MKPGKIQREEQIQKVKRASVQPTNEEEETLV